MYFGQFLIQKNQRTAALREGWFQLPGV